jgi:hypothetical protein
MPGAVAASAPTSTAPYTCDDRGCTGNAERSQVFAQIQDLINKANATIGWGAGYAPPTVVPSGRIDQTTVTALADLSASGQAPQVSFYDVQLTPQFIADNADAILVSLQTYLHIPIPSTFTAPPTPPTAVDSGVTTNQQPTPSAGVQCWDGSTAASSDGCPAQPSPPGPPTYPPAPTSTNAFDQVQAWAATIPPWGKWLVIAVLVLGGFWILRKKRD